MPAASKHHATFARGSSSRAFGCRFSQDRGHRKRGQRARFASRPFDRRLKRPGNSSRSPACPSVSPTGRGTPRSETSTPRKDIAAADARRRARHRVSQLAARSAARRSTVAWSMPKPLGADSSLARQFDDDATIDRATHALRSPIIFRHALVSANGSLLLGTGMCRDCREAVRAPAGDRSCLTGGCRDLGGEISFLLSRCPHQSA